MCSAWQCRGGSDIGDRFFAIDDRVASGGFDVDSHRDRGVGSTRRVRCERGERTGQIGGNYPGGCKVL
jgi:hypothetical protein